ncbi:hypothetical protein AB4Y88_18955 [Paenarthrobacter sp. RAF9]
MAASSLRHLPQEQWLGLEAAHHARVARYADPYLARRSAGKKHPVEDFLFTYYTQKPGQLLRWHPGQAVLLSGDRALERANWKFYRPAHDDELAAAGLPAGTPAVAFDRGSFLADRAEAVRFAGIILAGTAKRPAQFGCFGLHEWAMVYRQEKFELRHEYLKLRLSWRIRAMDMQASPYDLEEWGYPPIRIETPQGKAEYVEYQRAFAAESQELRTRVLQAVGPLLDELSGLAA